MAAEHSFDIVSQIQMNEVDNAIQQTLKEVQQRYDLKDSDTKVELNNKDQVIAIESADEYKVNAVIEILNQKLIKRQIDPRSLKAGEIESALSGRAKCQIKVQVGLTAEQAKQISKDVRNMVVKVQPQIQGDQVRIVAKKIDDLQAVIQFIKEQNYDFAVQFLNYR